MQRLGLSLVDQAPVPEEKIPEVDPCRIFRHNKERIVCTIWQDLQVVRLIRKGNRPCIPLVIDRIALHKGIKLFLVGQRNVAREDHFLFVESPKLKLSSKIWVDSQHKK